LRRADLGAALARIEERLDSHTTVLADIQTNAKATNGRVTKLERAWWYARGAIATITTAVGILAATGHLHIH
jgi:hypothetical protein